MNLISYLLIAATIFPSKLFQSNGPIIKGYVYWRESIPGTRPVVAGEDGTLKERSNKKGGTWFIYLEYKNEQELKPVLFWLNGKSIAVRYDTVGHLPVVYKQHGLGTLQIADTLVAQTNNSVMQVFLLDELPIGQIHESSLSHKKPEIEYYSKGKRYRFILPEIKNLPPIVLQ